MKSMRTALAILLIGLAGTAVAENTVYGLRLGEPLSLAECQKTRIAGRLTYVNPTADACVQTMIDVREQPIDLNGLDATLLVAFPPAQTLTGSSHSRVSAVVRGGSLEVVTISTQGYSNQDLVFDDLLGKYGPPTSSAKLPLTGSGATFRGGITAIWRKPDLVVEFMGVSGGAHTGTLRVMTPAGEEAINKSLAEMNRQRTPL